MSAVSRLTADPAGWTAFLAIGTAIAVAQLFVVGLPGNQVFTFATDAVAVMASWATAHAVLQSQPLAGGPTVALAGAVACVVSVGAKHLLLATTHHAFDAMRSKEHGSLAAAS